MHLACKLRNSKRLAVAEGYGTPGCLVSTFFEHVQCPQEHDVIQCWLITESKTLWFCMPQI